MTKRAYGVVALLISVVEIVLCFAGPIAFLRKPSLLLYPLFSAGLSPEDTERVSLFVERTLARTASYEVISRQLLVDYYNRHDPSFDPTHLKPKDLADALQIGRELEVERVAIVLVFAGPTRLDLTVAIRDLRDGEVLRNGRWVSASVETLIAGRDDNGQALDIQGALALPTRGLGLTDWLVLLLFVLQAGLGVAALTGVLRWGWIEPVWVLGLVLFVFAYVHALSANLDYVQRFIASGGQLRLARSTALEQAYAALRFGPLLLLGVAAYLADRLGASGGPRGPGAVERPAARWALPLVLLSAVLYGLSFPSPVALDGIGPLAWVSLVPLFLVLIACGPGRAILYLVTFGALQAMIINYWHGTYSYVTLHVVTLVLILQYLLVSVPLVALIRLTGRWGFLFVTAAWVVFDWVRSIGTLGYPWGIVGATQYAFIPLIQISTLTGVWGVGFAVVAVNTAVAWSLAYRGVHEGRRRAIAPAVWGLTVGALSIGAGAVLLARHDAVRHTRTPATVRVALIQENTDPRKHDYGHHLGKLYDLTDEVLARPGPKPDLVVWSEAGFPVDIRYSQRDEMRGTEWARLTEEFLAYQAGMGTWLVSGEQDHEMVAAPDGSQVLRNFNSAVLIDPAGGIRGYYHKMHLVPFSERFPLDRERFAGLYSLFQKYDISNWEPGRERVVFEHERFRFYTPICFEDLFPDEVRRFVAEGAQVIVNLSNDYWSLSPVEGRQHGLHALFRAVENRRPLVRATVSGYTLAVDTAGRIEVGALPPYTEGVLVTEVELPAGERTLYTRWGDWFPKVCLAAVVLGLGLSLARILRVRLRREA